MMDIFVRDGPDSADGPDGLWERPRRLTPEGRHAEGGGTG